MKNTCCKRNVLVVGLNPALQRSIKVNNLIPGSVNRGVESVVGIGGKGQDVIVAASCQLNNKDNIPSLLQFLGNGFEGDALGSLLEEKTGIPLLSPDDFSIRTKARCRTCITLVDMKSEEATEIIEPSEKIQSVELELLLSKIRTEYNTIKTEGLVIMGSTPPGCPENLYSQIISSTCDSKSKIILDTTTGLNDAFTVIKNIKSVPILKINAREFCKLANVQTSTGSESASATSANILIDAAKILGDLYKTDFYAAITDGPFGAYLFKIYSNSIIGWKYTIPALHKQFINPIGAGDAVASGLSLYICNKIEDNSTDPNFDSKITKAFSWGLACGSASCMTNKNSVFELNDCREIFKKIEIEELL